MDIFTKKFALEITLKMRLEKPLMENTAGAPCGKFSLKRAAASIRYIAHYPHILITRHHTE